MSESYPTWRIPEDFLQYSHYERVVKKLDWTSSPGYPYLLTTPTNSQLFVVGPDGPSQEAMRAVWQLVCERIEKRDADPIRLFVKPEPHKSKKIEEGRFRLISSVSVVDQIIDHLLHDDYDAKLSESWIHHAPKSGWTPLCGGWKSFPEFKKPLAVDKKAWDWTVRPWLLELSLRHRIRQCENISAAWMDLAWWRWERLYKDPVFILSSGDLFKQKIPGVRKSGCVTTLSDNSIEQDILHRRIAMEMWDVDDSLIIPPLWGSMGDDTIQEQPECLSMYLSKLGEYCLVKEAVRAPEFAGFRFQGARIQPLYLGKHAFNLLHVDPSVRDGVARSYALLYHRASNKDWIQGLARQLGELHSEIVMDAIYDRE